MVKINKNMSLKDDLSFPLYLCSKEVIRQYNALLDTVDLTYTQYIVMMFFWEKEKGNVKEIGDSLLLDSETLTPLLKKLEAKGFITRGRSSMDERNLNVVITNKGKDLKEKVMTTMNKNDSFRNITNEEREILYSLLQKVITNQEIDL